MNLIDIVDFDAARTDELVRMWRESFEFGVGVVDPHPIDDQRDYFMNTVVPNNALRMALLDDKLVGFIAATKESITHLYVRVGHHHRGIGTQLLAWGKAQSVGRLWLYAFARNAMARAFYEKHGFQIVARGFEPTWQLEDIKYEWVAQDADMTVSPRVWHYGLMAEYWSEFKTEAPEAPFFTACVERYGQPVLDLGCGTGRVLLPLLRAGIDIDGCDISADMIRLARQAATREGFTPNLYCQPMHELEVPRRYRMIYICGSFGLGGGRNNDLETLRRCHAHLESAGALILNEQMEYTSREAWEQWLPESRCKMPEPWPERGPPRVAHDGSQRTIQFRVLDVNALEQMYSREVRLEKWIADKLVVAEDYVLHGNLYLKQELMLMLRVAGFREVFVRGNYTDEEATPEHRELVFTAIR